AQVVQLGAPHLALTNDLECVQPRRMQQEGALHANAVRGDPAQREVLVDPAAAAANADPLELLYTLAVALDDPHADAQRVTCAELRHVGPELALLDLVQ